MNQIFRGRVTDAGRVVIPVELRNEFGLREGEQVLFASDAVGIRVTSLSRAIEQSRDFFSSLAPVQVMLSRELLHERRTAEACGE